MGEIINKNREMMLRHLAEKDDTVYSIAKLLGLSYSSVHEFMEGLEQKGYVEKYEIPVKNKSQKKIKWKITNAGKTLLKAIDEGEKIAGKKK